MMVVTPVVALLAAMAAIVCAGGEMTCRKAYEVPSPSKSFVLAELTAAAGQVLHVPKGAPLADIKAAYRQEALRWHPDKVTAAEADEAQDRFVELGLAYTLLSDEKRRLQCEGDFTGAFDDGVFVNIDLGQLRDLFQARCARFPLRWARVDITLLP